MLRPILPRVGSSLGAKSFRRSLFQVPLLRPEFNKGVPGLLSQGGFDTAWTNYQGLMITKLNSITAGGEDESAGDPKHITIKYAREPGFAPHFNYASMAHNNHFFFQGITPTPKPIPAVLKTRLEESFSSIETLKREMIITASVMFGPGFVWLVQDPQQKFSILTTYLAGTPYPLAHYRQQSVDMNTEDKSISEHMRRLAQSDPVNTAGTHGPHSQKKLAPGAVDIIPILCINTWEHVYLRDYGVGGKQLFAENWWRVIDWDVALDNAKLTPGKFER